MTSQGPVSYSYRVGVSLGALIFKATSARIRGKENVPPSGPLLIVANHQSFLDPLLVALSCPARQVHFMAKEELFRTPTSRHMMLGLGAFPVDRRGPTRATLAHVLKLLRSGSVVCLFPEGTRSKNGKLQEFQPGFARIAKKTNSLILPVGITGTRSLFEAIQGSSLPLWSKIVGTAPPTMSIGEPISADLCAEEIVLRAHNTVREFVEDC